jgi:hypothetical protein
MKFILPVLFLFIHANGMAQVNLIRNGSFEQHDSCPLQPDEIKFAKFWMSLDTSWSPPDWTHDLPGVPEFCHACAGSNMHTGIPCGCFSYYQFPRTGNGMAQFQTFYDEAGSATYKRDYLQQELPFNLIAGRSYCVTFYLSLADGTNYANNHIGAYFDDGTIDTTVNYGFPQMHCTPQVLETTIITDTAHWVKVQGSFTATGTERFMTIGNFSDKAHTSFILPFGGGPCCFGGFGWYLIDDISVVSSTAIANAGPDRIITSIHDTVMVGDTMDSYLPAYWYVNGVAVDSNKGGFMIHVDTTTTFVMALDVCGHITYDTMVIWNSTESINSTAPLENVLLYPNPASTELTTEHAENCELVLYNIVGKEVKRGFCQNNKEVLDISALLPGTYLAAFTNQSSGERKTIRLVKD